MKSGMPWQVSGVRREARETARQAAQRAGMSIGEWLDAVILESVQSDDGEFGGRRPYREPNHEPPGGCEAVPRSGTSEDAEEELEGRSLPERNDDRPAMQRGFSQLHQRLDELTRHLSQLAGPAKGPAVLGPHEPAQVLAQVLSKLDRGLDQLISEGRSNKAELERRVNVLGAAVADLHHESAPGKAEPDRPTPLDQALREIADRQRTLDGYPATGGTIEAPASEALPRADTQALSGLAQQLRQVNAHIEKLKPCGIDGAIETLRDDLAQIGAMLQDVLPRKSVEALEHEIRKLGERIDDTRKEGGDAGGLANIERGLAEVRDALRGLAPADNLPGIDRELQHLSEKIDGLAQSSHEPARLRQLENTILSLRGTISQMASNDALASLSDEVRALAGKVDRATESSGNGSVLNALEGRIAAIADAMATRNEAGQGVPYELEAVIKGLADKIEQVQLSRADHAALGHLEDRIARLVEKLDASDARVAQLEAIERGLAELLIHIEHQRATNISATGSPPAEVEGLSRDLAELRNNGKKTQESLEFVHGTLGHVVDRLAMIETDMRARQATVAPVRASSVVPEPTAKGGQIPGSVRGSASAPESARSTATRAQRSTASTNATQPTDVGSDESAALNELPQPASHLIAPALPPDHPLEPGSGASRRTQPCSPADRIAASQAVLAGAVSPSAPEAAGTSNFIAAARRAAQAAGGLGQTKGAIPKDASSPVAKLASRVGKVRALIGGTTGVLILLGGFQIAKTFLAASEGTQMAPPQIQTQILVPSPSPAEVEKAAAAKSVVPSPTEQAVIPAAAPPPLGRQSSVLPPEGTNVLPAPSDLVRRPSEAIAMPSAAEPAPSTEITGSVSATLKPDAMSAPATSTPAPEPLLKHPPSPADKLPAAFAAGLRTAAAKGNASAEYEIGERYAEGRGVAQNLAEAAEWFERAAKHGLAPAQFRLGGLYEKGLGVQKNLETARRLYSAAGEAGNAKALHNLAVLYAEGIDGKPDYLTAAKWFRKAADYGVTDSQYNLAVLYARGIGVEQNLTEAYRWFALAARDGDADSARKRDELASRLDRNALAAAAQALEGWIPQSQPAAAVEVKLPAGGWDEAASLPAASPKRKPTALGPKLDLATPRTGQ